MQQSKQEDTSQMNYAADFEMEEASFEGQNFIAETNESSLNRTSEAPISLLQNVLFCIVNTRVKMSIYLNCYMLFSYKYTWIYWQNGLCHKIVDGDTWDIL